MFEFKVDKFSQFWSTDGKKVEKGNWTPTFFAYIIVGDIQWLVVGAEQHVIFGGEWRTLQPVTCHVNSMENLISPCVAGKRHKMLS